MVARVGPCTPQSWILDIAKKLGILLIWNLDIGYYPLKMGYRDMGFTEIGISRHWFHYNYLFLPPLARQVEDINVLKSGYWDIGPPGAGPSYCPQAEHLKCFFSCPSSTRWTLPRSWMQQVCLRKNENCTLIKLNEPFRETMGAI